MSVRTSEWISLLAFSCFTVLALARRSLDRARRGKILTYGTLGIALTLAASLALPHWVSPLAARICRDWLPALLILLCYWQAGAFIVGTNVRLEEWLEGFDERFIAPMLVRCAASPFRTWIFGYLEIAYVSYYPLLPLSVAALYLTGAGHLADRFWTVVLLPAYGSYSALPFAPTRPPRLLGERWSEVLPSGTVRALNRFILRTGSIQANTFPSAHVAIATASALALLQLGPLWLGLVFLWVAISVAMGCVGGRYHYAADAILGTVVALAALLAGIALDVR